MFDDIDRDEWLDDTADLFVETFVGFTVVTAMIVVLGFAVAAIIAGGRHPDDVTARADE